MSGARVRCRVKMVSVEAMGKGRVLITTETTVEIEGQEKPALRRTACHGRGGVTLPVMQPTCGWFRREPV